MHAPVSPRRHITVTSIQQIQNWPIRFILASWSFHFSQVFTPNFIKNYWPGLKYNQSGRCTLLRWTFSYKFHQIKVTCAPNISVFDGANWMQPVLGTYWYKATPPAFYTRLLPLNMNLLPKIIWRGNSNACNVTLLQSHTFNHWHNL